MSAAPNQAQGPPPDNTEGPLVIGITCMLLTLCLAAVGGRLVARRMEKVRLEADDYLAIVSLVKTLLFGYRSVKRLLTNLDSLVFIYRVCCDTILKYEITPFIEISMLKDGTVAYDGIALPDDRAPSPGTLRALGKVTFCLSLLECGHAARSD